MKKIVLILSLVSIFLISCQKAGTTKKVLNGDEK